MRGPRARAASPWPARSGWAWRATRGMVVALLGVLKSAVPPMSLSTPTSRRRAWTTSPTTPGSRRCWCAALATGWLADAGVPVLTLGDEAARPQPHGRRPSRAWWSSRRGAAARRPLDALRLDPGLRDLHLGLDRQAQGRARAAPRGGQLPRQHAREPGLAAGDRAAGGHHAVVRHRRARAAAAAGRRAPRSCSRRASAADGGRRCARCSTRTASRCMQATPAHVALLSTPAGRGSRGFKALIGGEALPPRPGRALLGAAASSSGTCTARPRPPSGRRLRASTRADGAGIADRRARSPTPRSTSSTSTAAAGARRRAGRALHRRRRRGARLPRPARADGRALRARPVRRRARRAALPHRRPRPLAPRRPARVPGPRSTTRSRCAATASSSARSRRRCAHHPAVARRRRRARARTRPGRRAPGRLRRDARPARRRRRGAARAPARAACPSTWCRSTSCALDALPLLPNGKVDRKALPAPQPARAPAWRRSGRTASESAEATDRAGLAQPAGTPTVGARHRRHLEPAAGGGGGGPARQLLRPRRHSLLAMRAVVAIREELGWQVDPPRLVFETLEQIVEAHRVVHQQFLLGRA